MMGILIFIAGMAAGFLLANALLVRLGRKGFTLDRAGRLNAPEDKR